MEKYNLRQAFTLIEILVAATMLSVLFGMTYLLSNTLFGVKKIRSYETAIMLANEAVEAVRAARSSDLLRLPPGKKADPKAKAEKDSLVADFNSDQDEYDDTVCGFKPEIKVGNVLYKRTIEIIDMESDSKSLESPVKTVRILVEWKDGEDATPLTYEIITAHCDLR
ncbi:MAG: type II secretion system protein [Candidatus Riflebacteria bacterium]|nr:type II secretion system protein [Candidatus Riflebacteria bacterium]